MTGIEIGGALKNVMAIAAGMSDGLGFGHNARALLISRGLAEIARLGVRLGRGSADVRRALGDGGPGAHLHGRPLPEPDRGDARRTGGARSATILSGMTMVAEGVHTARAAVDLSRRTGVPMPISEQVYRILHEGKDVREAVSELFARALKREKE